MPSNQLPNKPLYEAILEIRWDMPQVLRSPDFHIFLAHLQQKLKEKFPHVDQLLPDIPLPEDVLQRIFHCHHRPDKNGWPLIQISPCAITLNETDSYRWDTFCTGVEFLAESIFSSAKLANKPLNLRAVALSYLNFFEFDFDKDEILDFLGRKLKLSLRVPKRLFTTTPVKQKLSPYGFHLQTHFPLDAQNSAMGGTAALVVKTGEKDNKPGILLDISVHTPNIHDKFVPSLPDSAEKLLAWADAAHNIAWEWFFTLIKGDLEKQFRQ